MGNPQTVPMFAPDGTLGDIPIDRMMEAKQAGAKPAVTFKSPDGQTGLIPADRIQDAIKAGGTLVPLKEQETQHPGFWHAIASDLGGMAAGAYHAAVDPLTDTHEDLVRKQREERAADAAPPSAERLAHGKIYQKITAPLAEAVGVNVPGMEQSAAEGDVSGVAGHAAAVPAAMAITEGVARGIPAGARLAKDSLPSTVRAGEAFQQIKSAAGAVPIDVSKVGDTALEIYQQTQRGGTPITPVNKLIGRLTRRDAPPLTYAEAKDFQSNISSLSANEKMSLKPNQVRLLGQLNEDLKASLADAADTVGKGQQFTKAMKEYHDAMKLKGYSEAAIDAAWKAAIGAAGVYGAAKIFGVATEAPKALRP